MYFLQEGPTLRAFLEKILATVGLDFWGERLDTRLA
jgi:hypothetical protein